MGFEFANFRVRGILVLILAIVMVLGGTFFMIRNDDIRVETIRFKATDGVEVTGELYLTNDSKAPFILLCHQAGYSRGEYSTIARELGKMGFNCLAIDQRSGYAFGGIKNATHQSAISMDKGTGFTDAYPDIVAALDYIEINHHPDKVVLWGSSYSASLAIVIAANEPGAVDAVMAFSPGEYFKYEGRTIAEYAKSVNVPVFITSAKSERSDWEGISDNIKVNGSAFFLPEVDGIHGSSTLFEETPNQQEYWNAVKYFLKYISTH